MTKSTITALYLLVITNLLGLAWIKRDFQNDWNDPDDYRDEVVILDSSLSRFDGDTYLNLKVRNDAPVNINDFEILVSVYDTNNVHLCTIEESLFSVLVSGEERYVSVQISYSELDNAKNYRFEPSVGSALEY